MKIENPTQISLANFFIYNLDYGQKEGKEKDRIFYYYPADEQLERQIRLVGFCAGVVKFTQTFNPSKPCEFVNTEKIRYVFYQIDKSFWMVLGLNVPVSPVDKIVYENDQISDSIYMSVLKQMYNYYRLFNGNISDLLDLIGSDNLRINLKEFYDNYIDKKLNIRDCDLMNTFNGIHFMSLDRTIYLKIQSLLNLLEEKVPLVNKTVVMYCDQVIWSGLEQQDISLIYNYLKDLVNSNLNNNSQQSNNSGNNNNGLVRFLIDESLRKKALKTTSVSPTTSKSANETTPETVTEKNDYYEFEKVHLGQQFEKYYLIPYNLSKLTFFIFIQVNQQFKLNILSKIDEVLAANMINILQDISEQRSLLTQEEKEIKYIYFNRLNLAQKSTLNLNNSKDTPKYIINLISQLSKDLENCRPTGEIFVKSGRDYWIACKKSDLREVYVVVCQKNANLTLIDEEVKHLCSTNFSNIFFME